MPIKTGRPGSRGALCLQLAAAPQATSAVVLGEACHARIAKPRAPRYAAKLRILLPDA